MIHYLDYDEAVEINAAVLGGESQLRDSSLLKSALARPQASAFGADAYASIHEKSAALLESLSRNHPFVNGNKRTAVIAMLLFLERHQLWPKWNPADALQFILAVAQGQRTIPEIAEWLTHNTEPIAPSE